MNVSIGQQLRKTRQDRDISLEQAARGTHIRLHYLQAIEAGDFNRLPSPVQIRGFLRAYAGYLGLDPEPLLNSLNGEPEPLEEAEKPQQVQVASPDYGQRIPGKAKRIFEEIGEHLRHQRDLLGLSLEDVERHTHLRIHYLKALEEGKLENLPSSVQGRGMLKNYAAFLGLNPDPLLLRFADGLQIRLVERQTTQPSRSSPPRARTRISLASLARILSSDFLLSGFLVLLLVGFVIWGVFRIGAMRSETPPIPTMPPIAEELLASSEVLPSPTPTASVTPVAGVASESNSTEEPAPSAIAITEATGQVQVESTQELPSPGELTGLVQVSLVVNQRTWVRATVDGEVEFEGRMLPGSAYTFSGNEEVEILTGNGAALQVFFNQQDLGTLGIYGEVIDRVFTSQGMVLPTPTLTPTVLPTATPTPQLTGTSLPTPAP
jgi:cytoskeleton protein RodZ